METLFEFIFLVFDFINLDKPYFLKYSVKFPSC